MENKNINPQNAQLQILSTTLKLINNAIDADKFETLCLRILNDTKSLIPYDRASFFKVKNEKTVKIISVSGQSTINKGTEFAKKMGRVVRSVAKENDAKVIRISDDKKLHAIVKDDYFAGEIFFIIPIKLLLKNNIKLFWVIEFFPHNNYNHENTINLLNIISPAYLEALSHKVVASKKQSPISMMLKYLNPFSFHWIFTLCLIVFGIFCALFTIFVPYKATSSFEIVSDKSQICYAPFEGRIDEVCCKSGDFLSKDDIVIKFDKDIYRIELVVLQKKIEELNLKLIMIQGKAVRDIEARAEVNVLKLQIEQVKNKIKKFEWYIKKSDIVSNIQGVLNMEEKNILLGKTVRAGERLFEVSNSEDLIVKVLLAEEDAFVLADEPVFFLHPHAFPEESIKAEIISKTPIPILAENDKFYYEIKLKIDKKYLIKLTRGARGVATIYGKKVLLGYYLARNLIIWWRTV